MSRRPLTLGLGCMRLSTREDRETERAVAVIRTALDGGLRFLDTADAYAWDDTETGHNERLISRALATWTGDRARIEIVTKGGLVRPDGRWVADGRAKHLLAAAAASRDALGTRELDVYLLHAPDPRTPFGTSVRALAKLKRAGLARSIGLSNVTVSRIEEALGIAEITVVEVPLSPVNDQYFRNGVARLCIEKGIRLIAHSPLGGPKEADRLARDQTLHRLASAHGATAQEVALAWLSDLHSLITPIPGATRVETVRSVIRASAISLTDADREALDERFPAAAALRGLTEPEPGPPSAPKEAGPERTPRTPSRRTRSEIVLIMGIPAAGKSETARRLGTADTVRLNRDLSGGSLRDLVPDLETALKAGSRRILLDNTYTSRAERNRVVEVADRFGVPVRCLWLDTPIEEAQINAVLRMIDRYGEVLSPEAMKGRARRDPAVFPPGAQFRLQRALEPPNLVEGFAGVERVPFERRWTNRRTTRGIVIEYDGVLRKSRSGQRAPTSPDDVEAMPGAAEALRRVVSAGFLPVGLAWHPDVDGGAITPELVERIAARSHESIGIELEWSYCPHAAGPPKCWCRKPLPGLVVAFLERHRLDPRRCVLVGPSAADRTLARRLGMTYWTPESFLARDG